MLGRPEVYSHRSRAYRSIGDAMHMASSMPLIGPLRERGKSLQAARPIFPWTYQNVPDRSY